jgi:hypothetical protein
VGGVVSRVDVVLHAAVAVLPFFLFAVLVLAA